MSLIRPAARAAIDRWRETAAGAALAALGLWWLATGLGVMPWVGGACLLAGAAVAWAGLQRARRPDDGGGPGVVEVDEWQITYLSGHGGGAVSIDALSSVEIVIGDAGSSEPRRFWTFRTAGQAPLLIPGNAEGARALFDALAALPGARLDRALAAAASTEPGRFMIWERGAAALPRRPD